MRQYQLSAVQQKQQAGTLNKPTNDPENRENNDPKRTSKSAPVEGSGVLSIPLASDVIMKIRYMYVSSSRRNFLASLNRKIFTVAERKVSNVNGVLGKSQLDPDKVAYIRKVTFRIYPEL